MIMPSKYLREDEALIGLGAELLPVIDRHADLSGLWEEAKKQSATDNFERFVLALDLLYLLGLIEIDNDKIVRVQS